MHFTVAQSLVFQRTANEIWSEQEIDELVDWIALHATDGDVIPGSGGLRKIRWQASSRGKRGGARVIYYNLLEDGTVWLLIAYTKAKFENLPITLLKELKNAIPKINKTSKRKS
jgi:mRNA-degrading endonuclease RelE of RelBE toxin-antitoxin system